MKQSVPQAEELARNPDYLLFNLVPPEHLRFVKVTAQTYRDSPFLDARITPVPTEVFRVPVSAIAPKLEKREIPVDLVIAHTSFCGSTLLARCAQSADLLILREPEVLCALAYRWRKQNIDNKSWREEMEIYWNLLGKRYNYNKYVGIKISNYGNNLIAPLNRQWPETHFVFMYGELEDFLISMLKHRAEAEKKLDYFLLAFLDDAALDSEDKQAIRNLPLLKRAAWVWSWQMNMFLQIARSGMQRIRFLPASRFYDSPVDTVMELRRWCNIGSDLDTCTSWVEKCFSSDAKAKNNTASGDIHSGRIRVKDQHAAEIAATQDWAAAEGLIPSPGIFAQYPQL